MTKYAAYGTELYFAGTLIAQVQATSGLGLSLDTEDVTTHDSTAAWEEVVATILRSGELGLDLVFDPALASQTDVLDQMVDRESETFELRFPDDAYTAWTFTAFVTAFEPDEPHDGALTASATLKLTGQPTLDSTYSP
jgi:predicted secreted protein